MPVEMLKGFLRIGFFIGGCGFVMIFMQPPGSPEYYVSICSALIGLTLVAGVIIVTRLFKR
ncbi:MAG: hypothetical protein IAE80_05105 [Anaerolinea sp.]|nr:hypothetical protein [Anaerolinea sp.]